MLTVALQCGQNISRDQRVSHKVPLPLLYIFEGGTESKGDLASFFPHHYFLLAIFLEEREEEEEPLVAGADHVPLVLRFPRTGDRGRRGDEEKS